MRTTTAAIVAAVLFYCGLSMPIPTSETNDSELEFDIPSSYAGKRIDVAVAGCHPGVSRTHAGHFFRDGAILINRKQAKPSSNAPAGQPISIELPEAGVRVAAPDTHPLN